MTNLEAVNGTVGYISPDPNIPVKALNDLGVIETNVYVFAPDLSKKIDQAAIAVLMALKIVAQIDEGGFGVTFSSAAADENIAFLCGRNGLPNPLITNEEKPEINDFTNRW